MVTTESLVRPFLEAAPAAVRPVLESIGDLDRRLWSRGAEGRAAWPDFAIEPRALVEFVARQLTPEMADAALDGLRPADLYLACACSRGLSAALSAFDRDYMREVAIALAHMRDSDSQLKAVNKQ